MASGLSVRASVVTDVGRRRQINEDWCGVWRPDTLGDDPQAGSLWVVADGVGAYGTGEEASRAAGTAVLDHYGQARHADPASRLRVAIEAGNQAVRERRRAYVQQGRPRPVLTTLLAALVAGERMVLANVGDCRAYLIRTGQITQLTRDHTWVAEQVADGLMSSETARHHPRRHVVTRALGQDDMVDIDLFDLALRVGDRVVLCSDGLTGHLEDDELLRLGQSAVPEVAAKAMLDLANDRGGEDNITVAVIEAVPTEASNDQPTGPSSMPERAAAQVARPESPHPQAAERREVTVVCASAGISVQQAPDQIVAHLNAFLASAEDVIRRSGGRLQVFPGGEILASFSGLLSGEDHVLAGVRVAMQIRSALPEHRGLNGQGLGVSIGIDSGYAILASLNTRESVSSGIIGQVVNVAAHLRDVARPGDVLVTGNAYAHIADAVEVEELGPMCLTPGPKAVPVYRVMRVIA